MLMSPGYWLNIVFLFLFFFLCGQAHLCSLEQSPEFFARAVTAGSTERRIGDPTSNLETFPTTTLHGSPTPPPELEISRRYNASFGAG